MSSEVETSVELRARDSSTPLRSARNDNGIIPLQRLQLRLRRCLRRVQSRRVFRSWLLSHSHSNRKCRPRRQFFFASPQRVAQVAAPLPKRLHRYLPLVLFFPPAI